MNLGTVNRLSAGTLRPPVGGARPNKGGYSTDIAGEDIRAWVCGVEQRKFVLRNCNSVV